MPKVHKEVHRSLSLKRQGNCMKGFVSGCYGDLGSLPPASQLLGSLGDFTQQVLFVSWGFFVSFCSYCDCKTWEAPLPSLLQKALGMGLQHPHNTSAKPGKDHCARRRRHRYVNQPNTTMLWRHDPRIPCLVSCAPQPTHRSDSWTRPRHRELGLPLSALKMIRGLEVYLQTESNPPTVEAELYSISEGGPAKKLTGNQGPQ